MNPSEVPSPRFQTQLCSTPGQKYILSEYLKAPYLVRMKTPLMTFTGPPVLNPLMGTCTGTRYFISERMNPRREVTFRSVGCMSDFSINLLLLEQRSVVILSHLPYSSVFLKVLHDLAPLYFSQGAPSLEAACHNIANWYDYSSLSPAFLTAACCATPSIRKLRPEPIPGLSCELGFMGSVLNVELPQDDKQQQQPLLATSPDMLFTDLPVRKLEYPASFRDMTDRQRS